MSDYRMALVTGHLEPIAEDSGPWVKVWGRDLEHPVYIRVGQDDGHLVCTGIVIGGDARHQITTRTARVPIAKIVEQVANYAARTDNHDHPLVQAVLDLGREELRKAPEIATPRVRPGASGYDDAHYAEVARRYRQALVDHPRSPTMALAETYPFHSPSTVRYWLRVCRQRGLIGRSMPGKAGER